MQLRCSILTNLSRRNVTCVLAFAIWTLATATGVAQDPASAARTTILLAPTLVDKSLLRGGPGAFGAPRENGKTHAGVDIVANQSVKDKEIYKVRAVSAGIVAYASLNGTDETNYGYTVVIDHGTGKYTLYSHLAITPSKGLVKVGDVITDRQIIGYMADLSIPELSSGNVRADVVKNFDKIQLHFELFEAPKGRTSFAAIGKLKAGGRQLDPTGRLRELGYKEF